MHIFQNNLVMRIDNCITFVFIHWLLQLVIAAITSCRRCCVDGSLVSAKSVRAGEQFLTMMTPELVPNSVVNVFDVSLKTTHLCEVFVTRLTATTRQM
jgi:hypothetical protein